MDDWGSMRPVVDHEYAHPDISAESTMLDSRDGRGEVEADDDVAEDVMNPGADRKPSHGSFEPEPVYAKITDTPLDPGTIQLARLSQLTLTKHINASLTAQRERSSQVTAAKLLTASSAPSLVTVPLYAPPQSSYSANVPKPQADIDEDVQMQATTTCFSAGLLTPDMTVGDVVMTGFDSRHMPNSADIIPGNTRSPTANTSETAITTVARNAESVPSDTALDDATSIEPGDARFTKDETSNDEQELPIEPGRPDHAGPATAELGNEQDSLFEGPTIDATANGTQPSEGASAHSGVGSDLFEISDSELSVSVREAREGRCTMDADSHLDTRDAPENNTLAPIPTPSKQSSAVKLRKTSKTSKGALSALHVRSLYVTRRQTRLANEMLCENVEELEDNAGGDVENVKIEKSRKRKALGNIPGETLKKGKSSSKSTPNEAKAQARRRSARTSSTFNSSPASAKASQGAKGSMGQNSNITQSRLPFPFPPKGLSAPGVNGTAHTVGGDIEETTPDAAASSALTRDTPLREVEGSRYSPHDPLSASSMVTLLFPTKAAQIAKLIEEPARTKPGHAKSESRPVRTSTRRARTAAPKTKVSAPKVKKLIPKSQRQSTLQYSSTKSLNTTPSFPKTMGIAGKKPSQVRSSGLQNPPKRRTHDLDVAERTQSQELQAVDMTGGVGLPTPSSSQEADIDAGPEPSTSPVFPRISKELQELARAMNMRIPIESKPLPRGNPTVWAESRQQLVETVPYFKKLQGGSHTKDGHVYSFLFDGVGHAREYMDSDVIVSRAGGGMESDSDVGSYVPGKDQSIDEVQAKSLLNDIKYQNPLIIISGDRNTGCPTKLPHRYCVLGWYKPVMVWAEKIIGRRGRLWTTIKYRFERLTGLPPADLLPAGTDSTLANKLPWFAPQAPPSSAPDKNVAGPLLRHDCTQCGRHFAQVYLNGWMCLNERCDRFWKLHGDITLTGATLYNPAFLLDRTTWEDETEPYNVKPPVPDIGKVIGDNLTKINTRGICCPECGRCNQRRLFSGWICENPVCSWKLFPKRVIIMPPAMHTPYDTFGDGPTLARSSHAAGIEIAVTTTFGYKVTTFSFPGIKGRLIHAAANRIINRQDCGSDAMLQTLQAEDLGLERRAFSIGAGAKVDKPEKTPRAKQARPSIKDSPVQPAYDPLVPSQAAADVDADQIEPNAKPVFEGRDMMTAFSGNYGMPYKFIANGGSKSFENAPWPIRQSRSVLNWAAKKFTGRDTHGNGEEEFNEQLVFAYMEGQKLDYHDDGEEGLGPVIGTLSLGGKSTMYLRMKQKHYVGCSRTGLLTAEEPVPGCLGGEEMYQKRHKAWTEWQTLKTSDPAAFKKRQKLIPEELGLLATRNKLAGDSVVVTLSHGDIVLMEGYEVQQYLEHKVVADGHLRFALTCRAVRANHLKESELPQYAVPKDDIGYDGSAIKEALRTKHRERMSQQE